MANAILYVISSAGHCKIGWTADIRGRLRTYGTYCPTEPKLESYRIAPRDRVVALERRVHADLSDHRTHGEWFLISPATALQAIETNLQAMHLPNLSWDAATRQIVMANRDYGAPDD